MTRIRVMHLINNLGYGGAERMLEKLLSHGDESAFSWKVVSLIGGGALEEPIRNLGIPVEDLGMRRGFPDPRAFLRFYGILRKWRPQVLQTWLYHSDLIGALVGRSMGVPHLVWNIRCTDNVRKPGRLTSALAPKICAWLSNIPDLVLSNSSSGQRFHEEIGYHPKEWRIIPNGFDLDTFKPDPSARAALRKTLSIPEGRILAGFIGGWRPSKDHSNLFQATKLCVDNRIGMDYILAGSGIHWDNPELRKGIEDTGIPQHYHLLGEQSDVQKVCSGLDFFILPSLFEGFPNVIGEALACGVPCVATRAGDTGEVLGDCGFLVPSGNPKALSAAMVKMAMLSSGERIRMGLRGRARILAKFEIGSVVQMYQKLYVDLVEGKTCAA